MAFGTNNHTRWDSTKIVTRARHQHKTQRVYRQITQMIYLWLQWHWLQPCLVALSVNKRNLVQTQNMLTPPRYSPIVTSEQSIKRERERERKRKKGDQRERNCSQSRLFTLHNYLKNNITIIRVHNHVIKERKL